MKYQLETQNDAGEWVNGIGDDETYEYSTINEAKQEIKTMKLDDFEASYRVVDENGKTVLEK